jgi:hypothetical protein
MSPGTFYENASFIFREVQAPEELLELLRMRYAVYRTCRLKELSPPNRDRLDVDPFDVRARHFGLYMSLHGRDVLAGGIRVVEIGPTASGGFLKQLTGVSARIDEAISTEPAARFPMLTYVREASVTADAVENLVAEGKAVVEPTRLILPRDRRSLTLARSIIEAAIAAYFFSDLRVDHAILTCATTQKRFYERYGFAAIPGTTDCYWKKPGVVGSALIGSPESVPRGLRPRIQAMADAFMRSGHISMQLVNRMPAKPDRVAAVA